VLAGGGDGGPLDNKGVYGSSANTSQAMPAGINIKHKDIFMKG